MYSESNQRTATFTTSTVSYGDSKLNDVERLFCKSLFVSISEGGSSLNRKSKLSITVERPYSSHHLRKDLNIRLTDDVDPFFIYCLCLTEDDFQNLKSQQGLLIDFPAFPQKFIDLIELCMQEEHRDSPKFMVSLSCATRLGHDTSSVQLEIVETNPFKYLSHLSLKLSPAPDTFIKTYLASCLKSLKAENEKLDSCLKGTQSDLQGRLRQCQETLNARNQELEHVRQQLQGEISGLSRRHSDDLRTEHDRIMRIHQDAELRWEKEKNELETKNYRDVQQLQSQVNRLEAQNKDYQEKLVKTESNVRELRSRFVSSEEELQQCKQRNQALTKENQTLDGQFHDHLKSIGASKVRLSSLDQELKEKDQLCRKNQELLQATQDQKHQLENILEQKQASLLKRENAIRSLSDELNKGNDIIRKLQTELKNYHAKLKLRSQISTKQEEAVEAKDAEIAALKERLAQVEDALKDKDSKVSSLTDEIEALTTKLDETQKQVKSNENIISWLNKQLNEAGGYRNPLQSAPLAAAMYRAPLTSTPSFLPSNAFTEVKQVLQPLGNRLHQQLPSQMGWTQTPISSAGTRAATSGQKDINSRVGIDLKRFERASENHEPDPLTPPMQSGPVRPVTTQRRSMDSARGVGKSGKGLTGRASLGNNNLERRNLNKKA